jgi:hypothetical protein
MMKPTESMQSEVKIRRRLLTGAGLGIFSLLTLFRFKSFSKRNSVISCAPPAEKTETIKVLSQDGRLVEVDVSKIKRLKEKVSDEELKNWIRNE